MSEPTSKKVLEEFDEEFGDLLSDIEPKAEDKVETTTSSTKGKSVEDLKAPDVPAKADVEAPDAQIGVSSFGTFVSSVPVPRFKASKDSKARFAILSKNVQNIKMHYSEGIGSFLCFDGKCCEFEGMPKVRYLIPIVQYAVDRSGKIISHELELKVVSIGAEQYQALVDAVQFSGRDVTDVDIVVTCSDEQYQKLTFAADASHGASWKKFDSATEIIEKFKINKDRLYMAVAKKISPDTYLLKKGFINNGAPASVGQFTDISDALDE